GSARFHHRVVRTARAARRNERALRAAWARVAAIVLSDRSAPPPEEPTELELALAEQRAQGVDIADLTEVDLRSGRDEAAVRTALCAPPGDPHVAVARSLQPSGVPIDPSHVVLAAGVDDAYARVFRLLCDPGDEILVPQPGDPRLEAIADDADVARSEEHTSELQSRENLVCRLLLEKKK